MFTFHSIEDYHRSLAAGSIGCQDAVEHYIARIEATRHLNAFVQLYATEARQRAKELDERRRSGHPMGRLHGVVIGLKDVIAYKDHPLTAASPILQGYTSIYNATAVGQLLQEEAIIIGHLNCDEFAMGSTNENSSYGKVLNGRDPERVPGGSSGGSAVAVQTGCCMISLGSDTGGSVRQPADFCGILGLKPTYGRVSRYGLIAYASSFDQIGIFGNNVPDIARVLEVIEGGDEYDSTVLHQDEHNNYQVLWQQEDQQVLRQQPDKPAEPDKVPGKPNQPSDNPDKTSDKPDGRESAKSPRYRVAYFKEALTHPGLDPEIRSRLETFTEELRAGGHTVEGVDFDLLDYIVPAYYVLTTAEASSNLSRFDGVKYGYRTPTTGLDLTEFYKKTRSDGFGREVKRRILLGTFVLSAGYYDAYFTKAQQVRKMLIDRTNLIFKDFDIILLPTAPTTAFRIGEKINDPIAMYLADIYTVYANLTGIPGISLPLFTHTNGMPFGVQAMANRFNEVSLLQFSHLMMQQYKSYENPYSV